MAGRRRSTSVALSVVCAGALVTPAAIEARSASASHSYVVNGNVIGGFRTATDGYRTARKLFGGPRSSTQTHVACIVRWPDGLVVTFRRKLPYAAFTKACLVVESARITGKSWRTDKGLRVGSAVSEIARAYPTAALRKIGGLSVWVLAPRLNPALVARVKGGLVQYLAVVRLTAR